MKTNLLILDGLLLTLGGNASPSVADITAVLASVGIETDATRVEKLVAELKGKTVSEVRTRQITASTMINR